MSSVVSVGGGNYRPFIVEKEWGSETTFGISEKVALKIVSLRPNSSLSRQVHLIKDEIYAVLTGSGRLELGIHGEAVHLLSKDDAVHIPPGVVHRVISGNEGLVIIEASTPEVNDIVRIEDAYNRQVNPDFDADSYREILGTSPPKSDAGDSVAPEESPLLNEQ